MNRYIIAGLLLSTSAFAQASQTPAPQPTVNFTITVTAQELDTIGNGLGNMPFKDAAPLINKLREQVIAQTKKPDDKPVDNSEKK
jgi:hypothetical protein